jgi:ribulose-5-phosphate 4-epimerase/fuculose-1-phosphate aldolase
VPVRALVVTRRRIDQLTAQEETPMCKSGEHDLSHSIVGDVADTADASDVPSMDRIEELVAANQILFDQGVVDAFGHISVRHDKRPDRFLLARNMAPSRVTAADIVEFTLDGEAVNAAGRKVYLERFIHGEIYRARLDVMSVVHSHSHSIVPLSVVKGVHLKAIFHMAGFVGQGAPVFEIREAGGDATDLLISNNALGQALAKHFDGHDIVLMRGHGSTVVGGSIKQAVYRAVYAELNARYQLQAMQLGEVTFLTEGESQACIQNVEGQVQRPWDMWLEQACARRS